MTIDRNDPRLTAYVLNELDRAEHARIEAALQESEELQKEVEGIRQACGLLGESLLEEPEVGLRPEQIEEIEKAVRPQKPIRAWWLRPGLPIAASVLLAAVLFGPDWAQRLSSPKELAMPAAQRALVSELEETAEEELDPVGEDKQEAFALRKKEQNLADVSEFNKKNEPLAQTRLDGSAQEQSRSADERAGWYRDNQAPTDARADGDAEKLERQLAEKVVEGRSSQVADTLDNSLEKGADLKQLAGEQPKGRGRGASGPVPAKSKPQVETPAFDFEARRAGNRETEMAEDRPRDEESFRDSGEVVTGRLGSVSGTGGGTEKDQVRGQSVADEPAAVVYGNAAPIHGSTASIGDDASGSGKAATPAHQGDRFAPATAAEGELGRRDREEAQSAINGRELPARMAHARKESAVAPPPAPVAMQPVGGVAVAKNELYAEAAVRGYHYEDRDRYRHPHPPRRWHRPPPRRDFNTESYERIVENPFVRVEDDPRSTFSIDVDTASFANVRRFLEQGTRPPRDAVRIEELINYFSYDYPQPDRKQPFSISLEAAEAPWRKQHRLVRIGLKGREVREEKRPSSNLVFLIDVSGSMRPSNKLPLLKKSMRMLVDRLSENDTVAMVVYAGATGLALPPTTGDQKSVILHALDHLHAGGSTNGGAGIELAYKCAVDSFVRGGVNRVILATDGDFNVGITGQGDLIRLIEKQRQSGVFLSVLGFGMGNLKDANLEKLADKGNGNYSYIDSESEARKVLVEQMNSTLVTIAKDVKIQIEFNPARVQAYRLIGYENRVLAHQDFNDDRKDAGEIGAGHTVTALYEVVPAGIDMNVPGVDPLRYQTSAETAGAELDRVENAPHGNELMFVRLRYKEPHGKTSRLIEQPLVDQNRRFADASRGFKFAAAVASFGMLLRDSSYAGNTSFDQVLNWALAGKGEDPHGHRQGFLKLVIQAQSLEYPMLRQQYRER